MSNELLNLLPLLLGLGVGAGLLAGLLGVGGGLIVVPVLFEVLLGQEVPEASAMLLATGTSLAVIVPTAISSSLAHQRRGNVDMQILARWAPGVLLAALFGAWLAPRLPVEPLILMFAVFAIVVALYKLLPKAMAPVDRRLPGRVGQTALAMLIGFVCVLLGVGAGTLGVAVFTLFNVPVHRAVGTAAVLGLGIAVPGVLVALGHAVPAGAPPLTVGHVSLPAFACIAPLAILAAPVGVRIGGRLSPQSLQYCFAGFLLLVGLRMLSRLFG